MLISAGRVATPSKVLTPGWVEIAGDRIVLVGTGPPPSPPDRSCPEDILVPGFVDMHVHGGGGASFSAESPEEALHVLAAHRQHGTTTMMGSLVTAPQATLCRQVALLAELVQQGDLAGVHLEGPWLSPQFAGAHDQKCLVAPQADSVHQLLHAGKGAVRLVTLAPELPNGLQAIRQLGAEGVIVGIGHSNADFETTRAAIDCGATVATHLFNAMPAMHHRSPGPALALMTDRRVTVELIPDRAHLHAATLPFAMRSTAGPAALVTDAMAAAVAVDGRYRLGNLDVVVSGGVARLADSDTIAGSTLTMVQGLRNAIDAGVPFLEAVTAATATPASALGLKDVGAIASGQFADMVLLNDVLAVRGVLRRGEWISASPV